MIYNYLLRHAQVFFYTLGQMARTPFASLMTIGVIGISLALPTGLYVLVDNAQRLSTGLDGSTRISVFLKISASETQARALMRRLQARDDIQSIRYISPAAALAEFKRLSDFGEAAGGLSENPLPPLLVVTPNKITETRIEALLARLKRETLVDVVQLDMAWLKRLHAILDIARRAVSILGIVLAAAVALIVGNTIRLAVLNRREEIEVIKLIGGTDAFIRRPFLYSGLLQAALGALLAWLLIGAILLSLGGPLSELSALYGSSFSIRGLGFGSGLALIAGGGALGWLGALIAVSRHLREIEPRQ